MELKRRFQFTSVSTEGAILPADLLRRIVETDASIVGLREADYHIAGEKFSEVISRSWINLQGKWRAFRDATLELPEEEHGTTPTRDIWLYHLFAELGFGRLKARAAIDIEGKEYPISHMWWDSVPFHLLGCNVELDRTRRGVKGAARQSPHSMVQEFLNRSNSHLWAVLSNGLRLRLLRDNVSFTRQAYVEFDLVAMFDGDLYHDFRILWLLCHQSRFEADRPEQCWLEKWSQLAMEQGTRALDTLRSGVEHAIQELGAGFLKHRSNNVLRTALRDGTLDKQDYYRQLLRTVYRLLFLFVAEDRDLLLLPLPEDAAADDPLRLARQTYTDNYSTARLRTIAEKHAGTPHGDLWQQLKLLFTIVGGNDGYTDLALPALGGMLFGKSATPDLDTAELPNTHLLTAIRELAFVDDRNEQVRRRVSFKDLRSEELGSIYESLLEMHPELNAELATFALRVAGGSERKTSGSYYTPSSLIKELLDSALEPVVEQALSGKTDQHEREHAILDLKVCDPASGSGHFLVAAAHRLAKRLAWVRTGNEEPAPLEYRAALRDVIQRCIYGVDINPDAVELCKVSLWLESLEPGKPLSFLDSHIKCGNSLLGATRELVEQGIPDEAFKALTGDDKKQVALLKKRNKKERGGQDIIGFDEPWQELGNLPGLMAKLEKMPEEDAHSLTRKSEAHAELIESSDYRNARLLYDAWCAAFVMDKSGKGALPLTTAYLNKVRRNPHDIDFGTKAAVESLAQQYRFFHWEIEFAHIFEARGGFDIVLGNPPWEHVELKEKEFFATRDPEIANAKRGADRKRMIRELETENPSLYAEFVSTKRVHEGASHFIGNSGLYPLTGRGRINTYAIFAERKRNLLNPSGCVGCIVQSDIASADTNKFFFRDLVQRKHLVSFYDFVNTEGLFPHIHRTHPHFCLLTISSQTIPEGIDFSFWNTNTGHLADDWRHFRLTDAEIALINPNTMTCPIFRSNHDAELTKAIYQRVPVLINEGEGDIGNPWGISFKQGLFNMTSDSHLFRRREEMEKMGYGLHGNVFFKDGDSTYIPLYEAKMLHHYNHRYGDYAYLPKGSNAIQLPKAPVEHLDDPYYAPLARYWVSASEVTARLKGKWDRRWLLGWRDITNTTNERTMIPSTSPILGFGHTYPLFLSDSHSAGKLHCLNSNLCSFCYDYSARQKLGGTHMTYQYLKQLPVHPPSTYDKPCPWHPGMTLAEWIRTRVLELTYTAWDLEPFARDVVSEADDAFREHVCAVVYDPACVPYNLDHILGGAGILPAEKNNGGQDAHPTQYTIPPYRWDEERRFLMRCELDAAYFHLYGIERDDVDYIMETFPIVKRKDEAKHKIKVAPDDPRYPKDLSKYELDHDGAVEVGEYRTKRVILEMFDEMQRAQTRGVAYETKLEPPPASPDVAHEWE